MNEFVFSKIKLENIFDDSYIDFVENNKIEFQSGSNVKFALLYAPNGMGKTSFTNVLSGKGEFEAKFKDPEGYKEVNTENHKDIIHTITNQMMRKNITGVESQYLIGNQIRKQNELYESIDSQIKSIFNEIVSKLKEEFGISKKSSFLVNEIENSSLKFFIEKLSSSQDRGKKIKIFENAKSDDLNFINEVISLSNLKANESISDNSFKVFSKASDHKIDIVKKIMNLKKSTKREKTILVGAYEKSNDGEKILKKYPDESTCIVCETENIKADQLLENKQNKKKIFLESLSSEDKELIEIILNDEKNKDFLEFFDNFKIKESFEEYLDNGNFSQITDLQSEITKYVKELNIRVNNLFFNIIDKNLRLEIEEYSELLKNEIQFDDEDSLILKNIVSDCIGRNISLTRDDNKYVLKLDDKSLLGNDLSNLKLSTGEENFISLSFEIIKAKNQEQKVIVIDDPISSFDSIFKNKIAFLLLKCLSEKNVIILSHNIDLLRLLHFQRNDTLKIYLLNNIENGKNGFVELADNEAKFILESSKILELFRNQDEISNVLSSYEMKKYFLISLIPFMRGYSNFVGNSDCYEKLSCLMHGYESKEIDIAEIYTALFNIVILETLVLTSIDIVKISQDPNNNSFKYIGYPLLGKTLSHSFDYLWIRLNLEYKLYSDFATVKNLVDKNKKKERNTTTSEIILKAFDTSNLEEKVFFLSRKTLINEFNHFEGNMNIFQPAIDISDSSLKKEKEDIVNALNSLVQSEKPNQKGDKE